MRSSSPSPAPRPTAPTRQPAPRPPRTERTAMTDPAGSFVLTVPSPSPVRARGTAGAGFWPSALAVARRTVRKFIRTPQLLVLATVQSAIFLVIFRYIFGGAINAGGLPYVDFLVPGFVTAAVLYSGMGAAAGVAEDLQQGL